MYMLVFLVSTSKIDMLVSMKLSEKYAVPPRLALLYDFVNSLDRRRYVEDGVAHAGGDEIETPRLLEAWMRERGLLPHRGHVDARDHQSALELRNALRDFLLAPPVQRPEAREAALQLSAAGRRFPLVMAVSDHGEVGLVPAPGSSPLGAVLVEMVVLAEQGQLERLKTCASQECQWIFFDRSRPANRHWCSSSICGNRQKTRAYRERQRAGP